MRETVRTELTVQEWGRLVETTKRWAYNEARSDLDTDHPEGVKVLDKVFNELNRHVITRMPKRS